MGFAAALLLLSQSPAQAPPPDAKVTSEYHFLRLEYTDLFQSRRRFNRGWWRQDWPEADEHFTKGIRRLTRIDVGEGRHVRLTDPRLYDFPWIYVTQVAYWDLSEDEVTKLRDYLHHGGFLMVDDFHGPEDWAVFRRSMERVLPGSIIEDLEPGEPILHVLYDIKERVPIPGLRHLRGGGAIQMPYGPPEFRAIRDDSGRVLVAIHFNQDVGDAWEHADLPDYPAEMTGLAYRFGINYILYAMTH
jgi:hypothetical protein